MGVAMNGTRHSLFEVMSSLRPLNGRRVPNDGSQACHLGLINPLRRLAGVRDMRVFRLRWLSGKLARFESMFWLLDASIEIRCIWFREEKRGLGGSL